MKLYIIRHGDALLPTVNPQRPLSDTGFKQAKHLAACLQAQGAKPMYIYHSGILRAQQTAEILGENFDLKAEAIVGLLPEDVPEPMLEQIALWTEDTMLVGHLPYLSQLAGMLCFKGYLVEFATATVVCFEKREEKWKLQNIIKGEG